MNEAVSIFQYSTPLALAALGECVVQRAGVISIGLEGTMLTAAFAGAGVAGASGHPWLGLLAAILAGLALALLTSVFSTALQADQVVVGTAFNLLALGLTGALYRKVFPTGMPSFSAIASGGHLDVIMAFCLVLPVALTFLLGRTGWGLLVRTAGEFPKAVEVNGFRVDRIRVQAIALGGVLAGLAGGYLSVGIVGGFAENMTAGKGFIAIAMVTFGRWNAFGVLGACLFIGALDDLQFMLQARGVNAPFQLMLALPYVAALAVLIVAGKGARGPSALGQAFRREH